MVAESNEKLSNAVSENVLELHLQAAGFGQLSLSDIERQKLVCAYRLCDADME